jgi:choline dehydrogenase
VGENLQDHLQIRAAFKESGVITCRMGHADHHQAVVDSRLRERGVGALRVMDASVMPTITSGNTNAPTLMIAEQAAHWICAEHRHSG